ncbi:hypothetical protein CBA19CS91_01765 [Paraburkholderia hospita]|nr:hypothetical protein CBA19CS91_01765 [Paraburkholderia hospita]
MSGTQATGVEGGDVPNVAASPAESQPESDIASSATSVSPVDVTPAAAPDVAAQSQADFAAATLPTALAEEPAVVPAAPVAIAPAADVTNSTITPLDGAAAPTVDEHEHPLHIAITRIEVYSENLGTEFMMQLKRLLSDLREEARKVL